MAQFVGKPLPDFSVKPLRGGELGAKTSLKALAADARRTKRAAFCWVGRRANVPGAGPPRSP